MRVEFRLTEREKEKFIKNAKSYRMSMTTFFKKKCINLLSEEQVGVGSIIHSLLRTNSICSNNLNQIAKNMNTYSASYSESDMMLLKEVNNQLSNISDMQLQLLSKLK